MKCRVGMLLICIAIMELAGCAYINPISTSEEEPVVYQELLSEYERVMKDTTYTEEQWGDNIYDYIKRCIGKTQLYYCIKDLVGDGKPELILGTMREGEYEILGTVYEEGCEPFIIYTYNDEGTHWASISEEYIMTIYKGGVVELISEGVDTHFMYEQIEKDEVFEKTLDTIVCRQIKDEEPYYYKYKMENGKYVDGEYEELSEDEFYNIRNQYTAVKEELEWKLVEGFWDAGILEQNSIDAQNGNVYKEPEDWYMDSEIALRYVGNVGESEEKAPETAINIQDSFVQIETNSIHKRIAFPSIDITDAEDVANSINEQIYHEIIPEDFWEYGHGREETEVQYEIESVGEEIVSIHFHGYQSYMGSYAEYNKGMNLDLSTGKIISLRDYYTLSDIKSIIMNARDRNEISILDFPVNEEEIEQEIDSFVQLFDSEEYVNHTDIFFSERRSYLLYSAAA